MIDKADVKCRFKRSVESYDDNAHVQRVIVERLYALLTHNLTYTPQKVLEIGCGTGLFTRKLAQELRPECLFINDLVPEMCSRTARLFCIGSDKCLVGDIEEVPLKENFDLIISASTFQWFCRLSDTFNRLASKLESGTLLVFSTFGEFNMHEINTVTGAGLKYYSKEKIISLLSTSFDVLQSEEQQHILYFSDPVEILRHLKKTGVNASADEQVWTRGKIARFSEEFDKRYAMNGKYPLTYHPLYFVCRKK